MSGGQLLECGELLAMLFVIPPAQSSSQESSMNLGEIVVSGMLPEEMDNGINEDEVSDPEDEEVMPPFSKQLTSILDELGRSELCRSDLTDADLIEHINRLFPTEQSLSQLDPVIELVEKEISHLDSELADLVEQHGESVCDNAKVLNEAKSTIAELEERISSIKEKTKDAETSISGMTEDIRVLDVAKKNLTSSITTLHHLHLLLTGVNSLEGWIAHRKYADVAIELPPVLNVLQLFEDYTHVEQVRSLTEKVQRMKLNLNHQLITDLKQAFKSGQLNQNTADMCKVAAVLGGAVEEEFKKWYISQQLAVYFVLYSDTEDVAWVDKIEERYRWFIGKLAEFERSGAVKLFPPSWEMGRNLAKEFCLTTRQALERLMTRRKQEIDWKLLAHAINHTIMFESLLCKRFPAKEGFKFEQVIWSLFDKFMDIFVAAQEKNLQNFIEECSARIRRGEERPSKEANVTAVPLASSAELFLLLKKIISESMKLCASPDSLLRPLTEIFRQCLRNYGHGCLSAFLPQLPAASSSFQGIGIIGTSSSLLANLMRDDSSPQSRFTPDQQFFTCCLLATADWCAETSVQLQEKLRQRMNELDLSQEIDLFYSISNNALALLVQDIEQLACDTSFQLMTKINWSNVDAVGDESAYVASIRRHLRSSVPLIRDYFADRRKYFAHFCLKLASSLVNKFNLLLFRCRPISLLGVEQLLLDTHSLKCFLLSLHSVESSIVTKPPAVFTNAVTKGMSKAEMVLKVVMTDAAKHEEFLDNYVRLLPDSDANELQKVLEMKGLRRAEQAPLLQLYKSRFETSQQQATTAPQPFSMSAMVSQLAADGLSDSSMRRLEKLVKRF